MGWSGHATADWEVICVGHLEGRREGESDSLRQIYIIYFGRKQPCQGSVRFDPICEVHRAGMRNNRGSEPRMICGTLK